MDKSTTASMDNSVNGATDIQWPLRLFNRSALKQRKYHELTRLLGQTEGRQWLDVGSDNGVISLLLRQRGGHWKSADLDEQTVSAIRSLVQTDVYQIDGRITPFANSEFDGIAIVDFLEHIPDDAAFVSELYRVLKPAGTLIVNVPRRKESVLRRFRLAIGQTDEKHGHVRHGYTVDDLQRLFGDRFVIEQQKTYSKFFSELVDTFIVWGVSMMEGRKKKSQKGPVVTGNDLSNNRVMFRLYSLIYPVVWLFSRLDALLFFTSGYMLIVKARSTKLVKDKAG